MVVASIHRSEHPVMVAVHMQQEQLGDAYSNTLQTALNRLHELMGSSDNKIAFNAAFAVLELEKARLRHKQPLAWIDLDHSVEQDNALEEIPQLPNMEEQIDNNEEHPLELIDIRSGQFEQTVDEIKIVQNDKRAERNQRPLEQDEVWERSRKKVDELGCERVPNWQRKLTATCSTGSRDC